MPDRPDIDRVETACRALSIALACGLLLAVWVVKTQSHATFTGMTGGFDSVIGMDRTAGRPLMEQLGTPISGWTPTTPSSCCAILLRPWSRSTLPTPTNTATT